VDFHRYVPLQFGALDGAGQLHIEVLPKFGAS